MRDYLEEYLHEPAPRVASAREELARSALREIIRLQADAVQPAETQIERQYHKNIEALSKKYQEENTEIEEHARTAREKADQRHEEHVRQIHALHESDMRLLQHNNRAEKARILHECDTGKRAAKREHDHEVWLAETVAIGAKEKLAREFEHVKTETQSRRRQLANLTQRAEWLLNAYQVPPPPDLPPKESLTLLSDNPATEFDEHFATATENVERLESLKVPKLFVGARPVVNVSLLCLAAVGLMGGLEFLRIPGWPSFWVTGPAALTLMLAVSLVIGRALKRSGHAQIYALYRPLHRALGMAELALQQRMVLAEETRKRRDEEVVAQQQENQASGERYEAAVKAADTKRIESLQSLEDAYHRLKDEIENRRDRGLQQAEEEYNHQLPKLEEQREHRLAKLRAHFEQRKAEYETQHATARRCLEERWREGLEVFKALRERMARIEPRLLADWRDPVWTDWTPPRDFSDVICFGRLEVDLKRLAEGPRRLLSSETGDTDRLSVPALLTLPEHGSLLLQAGAQGRDEAMAALRAVMVRLLTALPAGRVRFTIIDPVGLGQNFAGFMHLADYEEALVGSRIWTEGEHIAQRLADLTNHMENVIQKYLRNEFDTIDAYNAQAGELAEPYRFLVVANYPVNFNEEAARRLMSIVSSGARCGVYTLIAHDLRQSLPAGIEMKDIEAHGVHLLYKDHRFVWQDEALKHFPLTLDEPPDEDTMTAIMHKVGQAARRSNRVEVPFETVAPADDQWWSGDSSTGLQAPIGRCGAVRLQHLSLGRGVAQHALIAGKTGSGKSTLLHVLITNLALWYAPDEVEFYLVDFKKGVEFKTYATNELAHARAVAIESDREFGLSVLQRLDEEMEHRGQLFRAAGVQDIAAYREITGAKLPRTLLIVDEFQIFFSEDDKLGQDAAILLDRLVRQGRAFGIHTLLGSQTLGGTAGLSRSTLGQMAVRIALQCSEADSQLILEEGNLAARLLSRPGEAIYNDAGGLVQGNCPFQTAWLSDETRDVYLERLAERVRRDSRPRPALIVFEGNAPADIQKNRFLADALNAPQGAVVNAAPRVWLGEAVAIKDPTAVTFRRQSGANLLMVGQRDDAAIAMMAAALVALAAQHAPDTARFVILDGSPADAPWAALMSRLAEIIPHSTRLVGWREVSEAINELAEELKTRQESDDTRAPAVYVLVYALQRYRMLRRSEDDFSFSTDEEGKAPNPDKQFAELLREGPPLGLHVLTWADTPASLERTLNRQSMGEFDNRVLFQMSAADSSNLIDSPVANKLGFYRALFYSEEQGLLEKFRPYALPDEPWLENVRKLLADKTD
ncbi:MAG: cell division protein FtsK [Phycisphaerales bacterium]|nr:cell division protein FtsK [Phycisphaerales bacterium]